MRTSWAAWISHCAHRQQMGLTLRKGRRLPALSCRTVACSASEPISRGPWLHAQGPRSLSWGGKPVWSSIHTSEPSSLRPRVSFIRKQKPKKSCAGCDWPCVSREISCPLPEAQNACSRFDWHSLLSPFLEKAGGHCRPGVAACKRRCLCRGCRIGCVHSNNTHVGLVPPFHLICNGVSHLRRPALHAFVKGRLREGPCPSGASTFVSCCSLIGIGMEAAVEPPFSYQWYVKYLGGAQRMRRSYLASGCATISPGNQAAMQLSQTSAAPLSSHRESAQEDGWTRS